MARRIYTIVGIIAVGLMIYFILKPQAFAAKPLVWTVSLLYAVVVGCIHGILSHSLTIKQKGSLIFYPIAMGILFTLLAYIYLYVVLPQIIPGFMY